jgi:hypothetical protein
MGELKPEEGTRWRGLFSEQPASGQSIAGFCCERALPVWPFYEWRKRLRAKTEPCVAVKVVASEPAAAAVTSAPIEIRLRRGHSLLVGPDFEVNHLRRRLTALEQEP